VKRHKQRGVWLCLNPEVSEMLREDAIEQDMTMTDVATVYILAARRKIEFYICLELAGRSLGFKPRHRYKRQQLDWIVEERGAIHTGRDVPTVVAYKDWRLEYQQGETPSPSWHFEPGGNPRRNLKGWYLVGPGLSDTHHMWMGLGRQEAQRAAVLFILEAQARLESEQP
jgi:hypothetical protein